MLLPALVLVAGAALGYFGSRSLRRPEKAATAASVARNVGGALGRRRGLDAPDLQRACFSEMIRHVEVRPTGVAVPERFVIRLHPDDAATVDEGRRWFLDGLQEALRQAAEDNGWRLDTEPVIEIDADQAPAPRRARGDRHAPGSATEAGTTAPDARRAAQAAGRRPRPHRHRGPPAAEGRGGHHRAGQRRHHPHRRQPGEPSARAGPTGPSRLGCSATRAPATAPSWATPSWRPGSATSSATVT